MVKSMRINFKKLDQDVWSNSQYEISFKIINLNETIYKDSTRVDDITLVLKRAREIISKVENFLKFIEDRNPERSRLLFYISENGLKYSAYPDIIEIYF